MSVRSRLIAAGAATFILGMMLTFPARIAYSWFAPPDLRLSGISGTIWRGQAIEGTAAGIYLRDLKWKFLPWSLLRGRLAFAVDSDTALGSAQGDVGIGAGGAININNLDSSFSLDAFRDLFQLQGFEGLLQVHFESLVLADGVPTEARGSIRLSNLMARQISPLVIGDYQADFTSGDDGIVGSVEDLSGVLDVAGTITVRSDRSYSFVGKVAALPEAPPGLTNQLRFLGSPDERGNREFRIEGHL
jgi:general secretion pathway protein N